MFIPKHGINITWLNTTLKKFFFHFTSSHSLASSWRKSFSGIKIISKWCYLWSRTNESQGCGLLETFWMQIIFCRLPLFLPYLACLQVWFHVHKYYKLSCELDWLDAKTQCTAVSMEARVVWKLSVSHCLTDFSSSSSDFLAIRVNKIASYKIILKFLLYFHVVLFLHSPFIPSQHFCLWCSLLLAQKPFTSPTGDHSFVSLV